MEKNDLAIEKIVDILGDYTDLDIPYKREIAENILTKLSSVILQDQRWIPITKKLPDPGEDVLITVNLGSVNVVGVDEYSLVEEDGFVGYGKDVIAWMSFPKPYEPQENEE